jgi:UDP-N-acetylglucosamine 2-epimerase (non-hydrolysing)
MKLKVMTILGTRPEIIRLSRVIAVLEQVTDHVLVHTGQNYDYELNGIFFKELGVPKPRHYLKAAGKTAAQTIGNTISKVDVVLEREKPEAVLVLGDTNSCLAVIPAAQDSRVPHGGRQPLLRHARAGGDQPPHRGPRQ